MTLNELAITNFGPYRDRHFWNLRPKNSDQPIILIGGLNGGGKTTFLDAILLALYGKRADCSTRKGGSYENFLTQAITHGIDANQETSIELEFTHVLDGQAETFRVKRVWSRHNAKEEISVWRNGQNDSFLTSTWDQFIEELVPKGVSKLFFFDGERIEGLANLEQSKEVLYTAVHSLLGVDVVDQLVNDLNVLKRRKLTSGTSESKQINIEESQRQLAALEQFQDQSCLKLAASRGDMEHLMSKLVRVEESYRAAGGGFYDNLINLEEQMTELNRTATQIESEMRDLASGSLPLVLLQPLLQSALQRAQVEQKSKEAQLLSKVLVERDAQVLNTLAKAELPTRYLEKLKLAFDEDRNQRFGEAIGDILLDIQESSQQQLSDLIEVGIEANLQQVDQLLQRWEDIVERRDNVERQLSAVPDKASLAQLQTQRDDLRQKLADAETSVAQLEVEYEVCCRDTEIARAQLARLIENQVLADFLYEDDHRMVAHTERAIETLTLFRSTVVENHVHRIESAVIESLKQLLRKSRLVERISIDTETFALTLFDRNNTPLDSTRLSAGERQVLAVALLWGLAKSSKRELPTIIDTPLGRLDSIHRKHLVARYFPKASHQVILLSTDEEIVGDMQDQIQPSVGRSYLLRYSEEVNSSLVEERYFTEVNG